MVNYSSESVFIDELSKKNDAESVEVVKSYKKMQLGNMLIMLLACVCFLFLLTAEIKEFNIDASLKLSFFLVMCAFMLLGSFFSNRVLGKKFFEYIKNNEIIIDETY